MGTAPEDPRPGDFDDEQAEVRDEGSQIIEASDRRELHDHVKAPATPPGGDAFRGERMLRRRRTVVGAAAAAVVAVLGIVAVMTGGQQAEDLDPVVWSLERIRSEGSPGNQTVTESGITTRAYIVCDGPHSICENDGDAPLRIPYQHAALEVTQDGRSALFGLGANEQYWAAGFDADSVFVMDDPLVDGPTDTSNHLQMRYRLLRADGSEVQLQLLDNPAPAVPGPGVFVIDHGSEVGGDGFEHVYLVDEREGTLRPLDVQHLSPDPRSIDARYWGPNVDEFLWFVDRNCRVVWAADGTFEERRLECAEGYDAPTYVLDDWFPDGWLQPGRMALGERNNDRLFLHVSLDYGSTWQRIPVSGEEAIPDALRQLG